MLIRHLWQLKTVAFLHRYVLSAVLLIRGQSSTLVNSSLAVQARAKVMAEKDSLAYYDAELMAIAKSFITQVTSFGIYRDITKGKRKRKRKRKRNSKRRKNLILSHMIFLRSNVLK